MNREVVLTIFKNRYSLYDKVYFEFSPGFYCDNGLVPWLRTQKYMEFQKKITYNISMLHKGSQLLA